MLEWEPWEGVHIQAERWQSGEKPTDGVEGFPAP
jgi:hypothetical protein